MKTLAAILLLLGSITLPAQADSTAYCPFAIENATWVVYDNVGFYTPVGYEDSYVVKIKGDSVHNNTTYKKMWVAHWLHDFQRPSDATPPYQIDSLRFFGLVRDDLANQRFVGIIPYEGNENNEEEVVIHDFGITIGDPMVGVYKWDTVQLTDLRVDTIFSKPRLVHVPPRQEILTVAGIGTLT
ncbi:MAG: hypothetical protein AAF597_18865, partial [Bacteroidota bacterium]